MKLNRLFAPLALITLIVGCDDSAGPDLTAMCVQGDLIMQCPAASSPILGVRGAEMCDGVVGGIVTDEMGTATGQCHGTAECRVFCQFAIPCRCGVAEISVDGVLCASCEGAAACGDGVCEGGEDPMQCPGDCGPACVPDERRCAEEALEICDQRGRWDRVICPEPEVCEVGGAGAECVRPLDIVTGDMGPDDGVDGGVIDNSRIIPGPAPWPDVRDVRTEPFGLPAAVHLDIPASASTVLWAAGAGDTVIGFDRDGWQRLRAAGEVDAAAAYPGGRLNPAAFTALGGGAMMGARVDRTLLGAFEVRTLQVEALGPVGEYELAGRRVGPLRQPRDSAISISPDGGTIGWIAAQDRDSAIVLWDRGDTLRGLTFPRSGPQVLGMALSNDGQVLATHLSGTGDPATENTVSIWDTQSEQRILSIRAINDDDAEVPMRIRFSPSGYELAVLYLVRNGPPFIEIWDLATAERRHTLALPERTDVGDKPLTWDWAPDGRLLAMHVLVREPSGIPERGAVSVFDTQTGQRVLSHDLFGPGRSVTFAADGRLTASISRPDRVAIYGPPR